jgi:hypothetical protein
MSVAGRDIVIQEYRQNVVTRIDYIHLLRQYAIQHYFNGEPNLQEDYNPDTGKPIVGLDRSHHYNHSGFIDLIITGLAGLRPREDDTLEINPLVSSDGSMPSFCLQDVPYHGHSVTILWDEDGKRNGQCAGLSVFVDSKRRSGPAPLGRALIPLGKPRIEKPTIQMNWAVNVYRQGYPAPSASGDPENIR